MVKLAESRGQTGEGFTRIFGNERIGLLLSRVQAAVIRSGFELEETLWAAIPDSLKTTLSELNEAASEVIQTPSVQVVYKPSRPDPENPKKSVQADFLIADNRTRTFLLVEVKEGYVFDTKKADGELASLKGITSWLAQEYAYRTHYSLCSFNQEDKHAIVNGTKKRFSIDHVMTGREFCDKIGIDYDGICQQRKLNQTINRRFFLNKLLGIPEIKDEIIELLKSANDEQQGNQGGPNTTYKQDSPRRHVDIASIAAARVGGPCFCRSPV